MKRFINRNFIFCFFFLFYEGRVSILFAQDIHYTQYNASPLNLNPAQTGVFDGDWRFAGNYRTQWGAVTIPYSTYSISADTRLNKTIMNCTPALGLVVNTDNSGDSKYTTTQIYLSIGIIKKLNKESTHFISIAIQPGFATISLNTAALTFDKQYNGTSYNSSLSSGENFTSNNISYFDGGGGLAYIWKKSNRKNLNIGASFFHLNTPNQSFFNNESVKLDIKTIISGTAQFPVAEKLDLLPTFFYQQQGVYNETLLGASAKYYLIPAGGITSAISFGFVCRYKDACNFIATLDYRNYKFGVSYDVNVSKLRAASNYQGAFEMSLIYILKKAVIVTPKKRVCPVYM